MVADWPCISFASENERAQFLNAHCASCHTGEKPAGDLNVERLVAGDLDDHTTKWERIVRKLNARQMPPAGEQQPDPDARRRFLTSLIKDLDQRFETQPAVAYVEPLRRLNRTEYQNAIRDLFGIELDMTNWLPADESSHGFDNITVSDLSPTLLNRYITAAQRIAHMVVGAPRHSPSGETYRVRPDITQDVHLLGLPIGTRGGIRIAYHAARPGTYEIIARLARDRNEEVEGLRGKAVLEIAADKERIELFEIKPPKSKDHTKIDAHLRVKTELSVGSHILTVAFLQEPTSVLETKRQPYQAHYNMHRHPRLGPAIYEVSINGPLDDDNTDSVTLQRLKSQSTTDGASTPKREQIVELLSNWARRAYRRQLSSEDIEGFMTVYDKALKEMAWGDAVEQSLASILVSPHFLLKIENDAATQSQRALNDNELASRLAFFLWSSLPDDRLIELASANRLREPNILQEQVERMLHDNRADNLADNFAEQWLHLRNLESITPDLRLFPDFDDNLRQAFRQETRLLFQSVLRDDRSVLDLIRTDTTYLNERLAKHYGVPGIYGSRFRAVGGLNESHRGGILRHGSILLVTSYATRTSPVLRGHWVLKNLLGAPPPPPPANVPALKDNTVSSNLPMRERLAQHREQAACASCHNLMDPIGFALENFDAVGRLRTLDEGIPIDNSGSLSGQEPFHGVEGLERALLENPDLFVSTLTEKLMTFALGRGVDEQDAPAIRRIVREASVKDYRFSSIILGIVSSYAFQHRSVPQ